ncbi:MAG: hypothetical protein QW179_04195 [Candidatus Hadarchaeales archaeon]
MKRQQEDGCRVAERGFFSIDAFFAFMLVLLIVTSFTRVYEGRLEAAIAVDAKLQARMVGEKLAAALNETYANQENFELRVTLPENIGSFSYRVRIDNVNWMVWVEISAWGSIGAPIVFNTVKEENLTRENFIKPLRIYWDNGQVRVVSG